MTDYSAATGTWTLDPTHTTIAFSARHAMVAKVRGRFGEFEGTITIDGANPSASSADVTIKADSVDTRTADRDAHLKSADFLDVEKFPELTFKSTGIKQDGDTDFTLSGDLTIVGVTRPVEVEVEFVNIGADPWGGTRIGFEGKTTISRKDFGLTFNIPIDGGGVVVGDKITIELDVEAVKVQEEN